MGLTIPWNCKPSGEPYYKPPGLLIQYDEYYPYILLCDFKSLWQQDDLMDYAANLTFEGVMINRDPDCDHWRWSWSILFGSTRLLLIFGSEEDGALTAADLTTCSYTTAALLRVNEKCARSTTTPPTPPPQPQLKMIKKTLTMNSCCAPSTTTPRWCLKSCCCSRLFASSWWWISFCSAAKLNTRASLNRKPPMY